MRKNALKILILSFLINLTGGAILTFAQPTENTSSDLEQKEKIIKKRLVNESVEKIRFFYANKQYEKSVEECNNLEKIDPGNGTAIYYRNLAQMRQRKMDKDRETAIEVGLKPPPTPEPVEYSPSSPTELETTITTAKTQLAQQPLISEQTQPQVPGSISSSQVAPPPTTESQPSASVSSPTRTFLSRIPFLPADFFSSQKGKIIIGAGVGLAILIFIWTILSSRKKRKLAIQSIERLKIQAQKPEIQIEQKKLAPGELPPLEEISSLAETEKVGEEIGIFGSLSGFPGITSEQEKKPEEERISPKVMKPTTEPDEALSGLSVLDIQNVSELSIESQTPIKELPSTDAIEIEEAKPVRKVQPSPKDISLPKLDEIEIPGVESPEKEPSEIKSTAEKIPILEELEMPAIEIPLEEPEQKEVTPIEKEISVEKLPVGSQMTSIALEEEEKLDEKKKEKAKKPEAKAEVNIVQETPVNSLDLGDMGVPQIEVASSSPAIYNERESSSSSEKEESAPSLDDSIVLDSFLFDSSQGETGGKSSSEDSFASTSAEGLPSGITENLKTSSFDIESSETLDAPPISTEEAPPSESVEKKPRTPRIASADEDTRLIPTIGSKPPSKSEQSKPHPIEKKSPELPVIPSSEVEESIDISPELIKKAPKVTLEFHSSSRPTLKEKPESQREIKDFTPLEEDSSKQPFEKPASSDEKFSDFKFELETEATMGVIEKKSPPKGSEREIDFSEKEAKIDLDKLEIDESAEGESEDKEKIEIENREDKIVELSPNQVVDRNELLFKEQYKKGMAAFNKKEWKKAVHYLTIASAIRLNDADLKEKLRIAREERKKLSD